MKHRLGIYISMIAAIALVNILVHCFVLRYDLTDDKRYTLHPSVKQLVDGRSITITCYLEGDLNSGFRRLRKAVDELADELNVYGNVTLEEGEISAPIKGIEPVVIHERTSEGKMVQTTVYPYAKIRCGERSTIVSLLKNQRGLSGEENLNQSIENLEYTFAEAIDILLRDKTEKIAFIEGHGELPEENVYDLSMALSRYFQIDRGQLGEEPGVLDDYKVVIIADPQEKFSDREKFVLDQYLMSGGRILWVLNGVRFSENVLAKDGFTPVIPLDLNLQDMLFQYGVRIEPVLVEDLQSLPIPVDVSAPGQEPNFQPMPWYYAPLLLGNQYSPVTHNIGQVSSTFASAVSSVNESENINKTILLATSTTSRVVGTPAEVDLGELNPDLEQFRQQYIPVAMAIEGVFPSAFRHLGSTRKESVKTKQIVIASGSIIRNEVQQGQLIPLGYDRYSGMQFANRDFLCNAILYLNDDNGLINLRQREVALRLLNDHRAHQNRAAIQWIATALPLILLALVAACYIPLRKWRWRKNK